MYSERLVRHVILYALIAGILVLAMVDTGVFCYPSLSTSLLPDLLICCLSLIPLGYVVKTQCAIRNCGLFFLFAWTIFIVVYCMFVPCEHYRIVYIISTLLFAIDLICLVKLEWLKWRYVGNIFQFCAFLQISAILLQMTHVVSSGSEYFSITGFSENPSATAIFLALCLPIIIKRLNVSKGNFKIFYLAFFLVMLASIFVLKCRTAYVGCAIAICISYLRQIKKLVQRIKVSYRVLVLGVVAILLFSCGYGLYKMKVNSSKGRALIWKNTVQLVVEKPLGYGYGMFEKEYNLKQSAYFLSRERSKQEILVANQVFMPYNDTLEQCVEGGVVGGLFYLLFYIVMICKSYKRKKHDVLAVALCALIMSMFNFLYTFPIVWLLLMCNFAEASVGVENLKERRTCVSRKYSCAFVFVLGGLVIVLLNENLNFIKAQYQLKKINLLLDKDIVVDDVYMKSLKKTASTSELYYVSLAKNFFLERKYDSAVEALAVATDYTSSPSVYLSLATNYARLGNIKEAIRCVQIAKGIIPHHFLPEFLLMELYVKCGEKQNALAQAHHILKKPIKVHSEKVDTIRNKAIKYIQAYEK